VLLPAFYARKEMRKPLFASVTAICLNIVLNLILMGPLKQGGIALATTISSLVNNAMLFYFLKQDNVMPDMKILLRSAARGIAIAFLIMLVLSKIYALFEKDLTANRWLYALSVIMLLMLAGVFYLGAAWICRSPECAELFSVVKKRTNRKS
jgi:putative peptidoglycan lipid II flippase